MLLAARALGLGATLTTLYLNFEKDVEALGLPVDWHSYALMPIGYPLGRFGPVRIALGEGRLRRSMGSAKHRLNPRILLVTDWTCSAVTRLAVSVLPMPGGPKNTRAFCRPAYTSAIIAAAICSFS